MLLIGIVSAETHFASVRSVLSHCWRRKVITHRTVCFVSEVLDLCAGTVLFCLILGLERCCNLSRCFGTVAWTPHPPGAAYGHSMLCSVRNERNAKPSRCGDVMCLKRVLQGEIQSSVSLHRRRGRAQQMSSYERDKDIIRRHCVPTAVRNVWGKVVFSVIYF